MPIRLILHTLSTSTTVSGECCVFWQNPPKIASGSPKPKLIDATPLTLDAVWSAVAPYQAVTLLGIDVLLPLKLATPHQITTFVRALSNEKEVSVILNSDDALRSTLGDQEVLLKSLSHSADTVTALRALPSGRDREFAGMARFTRGYGCDAGPLGTREGERLYKYQENMMTAIL